MNLLHDFSLRRGGQFWRSVLVLLLCLLPFRLAQAAQEAPRSLLLGEFGSASLAEGDAVQYALTAPRDGTYTVAFTGDGDPGDFLLTLAGADGSELYNDVLQGEIVVDLTAGDYLLTFTAQADADLAFLVGIEAGSMSTDMDAPGELFNGSVFVTEAVAETLYATLTIAPSSYPQQVLVLVQGDDDVYTAEVTSEDFDYYYTSTDESDLVRFVSSGGEYQLVVTPTTGGAALQVSVFLSGPAPVLELGVETDGELTGAEDEDTYQITVAAAGTMVAVTATSETDLTLSAGLQPGAESWMVYGYADEPTVLEFIAPEAGVYYITVATDVETGAAYTLLAEDRGAAPVLPLDEPTQGSVEAGRRLSYLVNVEEPEQFLIVVLAGPAEEDLDLSIAQYIDGEQVASDSAALLSSREVVGLFAAEPGVYVVQVDGSWAEGADFVILASTGALADLLGEEAAAPAVESTADETAGGAIEQWAVAAEASSQYTDDSWSAQQATGAPDTPEAGDNATAWAAAAADDQVETLALVFEQPVNPTAIEIYESFNPGAVTQIEVLDPNTDEWVVVWSGEADTVGQELAVFSPVLTAVDFVTDQVRLTIDEPAIAGWNEIDAVKLIGVTE